MINKLTKQMKYALINITERSWSANYGMIKKRDQKQKQKRKLQIENITKLKREKKRNYNV